MKYKTFWYFLFWGSCVGLKRGGYITLVSARWTRNQRNRIKKKVVFFFNGNERKLHSFSIFLLEWGRGTCAILLLALTSCHVIERHFRSLTVSKWYFVGFFFCLDTDILYFTSFYKSWDRMLLNYSRTFLSLLYTLVINASVSI